MDAYKIGNVTYKDNTPDRFGERHLAFPEIGIYGNRITNKLGSYAICPGSPSCLSCGRKETSTNNIKMCTCPECSVHEQGEPK